VIRLIALLELELKDCTVMNDLQAPGTSFVSTNSGFLASASVMSPHMSSWHMPDHMTGSHGGDILSSSLNDSYLSSYFSRSATLSSDVQQVSNRVQKNSGFFLNSPLAFWGFIRFGLYCIFQIFLFKCENEQLGSLTDGRMDRQTYGQPDRS